jgi:hypothetical protein
MRMTPHRMKRRTFLSTGTHRKTFTMSRQKKELIPFPPNFKSEGTR